MAKLPQPWRAALLSLSLRRGSQPGAPRQRQRHHHHVSLPVPVPASILVRRARLRSAESAGSRQGKHAAKHAMGYGPVQPVQRPAVTTRAAPRTTSAAPARATRPTRRKQHPPAPCPHRLAIRIRSTSKTAMTGARLKTPAAGPLRRPSAS